MSKARQLADNGLAAPNRNILINGAMNVAQRATSVTGLGANAAPAYSTVDRWGIYSLGGSAGRYTMTQETITDLPSFAKCMKLACTTADTSIGSTELLVPTQIVEGQNLFRTAKGTSGALPWTISFYVKANGVFNYVLDVYENDSTRLASRMFATTTSWVRHEFTIPADTANGTITNDNTASLYLGIILHAGSNYTSGTMNQNTWADITNANRAPGISSFYSSTDNTFFLTGFQLEVGEAATPFEHEDIGTTLRKCYRYTQRVPPSDETSGSGYNILGDGYNNTATENLALCTHYEIMRADPSIESQSGSFRVHIDNTAVACSSAITMDDNTSSKHNTNLIGTVSSGLTAAEGSYLEQSNDVDAHIILSAEL